MTINSTTRRTLNLAGNGNAHTYPFSFKVFTDADVIVKKLEDNTTYNFTISSNGSYSVDSRNSITRNNEKKLILLLSNKLADKILNETNIILNDI